MENELVKIFKKAKYEPDQNMAGIIWQNIYTQNKRINQFKLWVFGILGFSSMIGLAPAINMMLSDLSKSGIYEYFSLFFDNGNSILSYWKELMFSLAESIPIMSIIFTLSLIFIFFLSLKYILKQIYKNQSVDFVTLSI